MTVKDLQKHNAIYISNIQDGFDQYHHQTLTLSEEEAFDFFQKKCRADNYEYIYADFYYYTLDTNSQVKIRELLNADEITYLEKDLQTLINNNCESLSDAIIFPLNDMLLRIICKLNAKEMLFSTIYFTKNPCTYWGNFNCQYVCFS